MYFNEAPHGVERLFQLELSIRKGLICGAVVLPCITRCHGSRCTVSSSRVSIHMAELSPKRIESIYLLKAISSFFVVTLHSSFFLKEWLFYILGVGTPCFLCITGYLLYSNSMERELGKCTKWAKKTLKLSLVCSLFYIVFREIMGTGKELTLSSILCIFVNGSTISTVLWYLTALWHALLLFWLMRKYVPKLIYVFPFVFALAYMIRSHPDIICPTFDWYETHLLRCNAIVMSLPFLCTGYLIHKHKDWLLSHVKVEASLLLVMALLVGEFLLLRSKGLHDNCYFIFTYPCIVLLLLLCVKYPSFKLPVINQIGFKHSANIYYFHVAVVELGRHLELIPLKWESPIVWLACVPVSMAFNALSKLVAKCFSRQPA